MLVFRKTMICIAAVALPALVFHAAIGAGGDDWATGDAASEHAAKIALGNNANAVLSLDLIAGGGTGNQRDDGVTAGAVSGRGTKIAIEVFATGVRTSLIGIELKFDFDASLVRFVKAENSAFGISVTERGNLGSRSPVTLASSGFLARAEFETVADVTGREFSIGIERVTLAESVTSSDVLRTTSVIVFNATPSPDFDGDGTVGFSDLLIFAASFGTGEGDSGFEARFDLNGDGHIGFADLLIFAGAFGTAVQPPSGGGGGGGKMYWADYRTDKIQRANLDGSGVEDLVTGLAGPYDVTLDLGAGKMYWTDQWAQKIQRANLDGSAMEDLITRTSGLDYAPENIALDLSAGKMYWTETRTIRRANLDGSGVEDLVTGLEGPLGVAMDLDAGKIYWGNYIPNTIRRANLDGSAAEDVVSSAEMTGRPLDLALDLGADKMYWLGGDTIQRANLDGSGIENILTVGHSQGIALDLGAGKIYWTDDGRDKIQRANLDGSGVEDLVTSGLVSPFGIALDVTGSEDGGGTPPPTNRPDLIVESPSVDDNTLTTGQSFTLSATVRNQGNASAGSTTLRYYRSSDSTTSTNDVEVGKDAVSGLSAGGTSAESISLNAPSDAGTYYYGACVDGVSGESDTDNNCSSGVSVTVSSSGGGGNDKAVTASITGCSAKQNGFIFNVVIAGTVHASRSVTNILIQGYVGASFVGIASIGSMSAGQSRSFAITGITSSRPSGTCRIEFTWRQVGNTSQDVVEHHSFVVDER